MYMAIMFGEGAIAEGYSFDISPVQERMYKYGLKTKVGGVYEPRFGLSTSVQTMTVAMLISRERGVSTCNLHRH